MYEINPGVSKQSKQANSKRKEGIKMISLIKINPKFSKTKKNNKSFLGIKRKLLKKIPKLKIRKSQN